MFKSLGRLAGDIVDIATAPVEIAADAARVVTKPVAQSAKQMTKDFKEVFDEA